MFSNKASLSLFLMISVYCRSSVSNCPSECTASGVTISYTESSADLINPERGYYVQLTGTTSSFNQLSVSELKSVRSNNGIDLVLRLYVLDNFVSAELSESFLAQISADFTALRTAGFKAIIRFCYTVDYTNGQSAPYGDADKPTILNQIQQLSPVLKDNSDVIAAVQTGFIGIWGEWYYTTHFGDPDNGAPTKQQWDDRRKVVESLLQALPTTRIIQLRTPNQKIVITGRTIGSPLTKNEAHTGSNVSRIGHHNDCFLASDTDYGTYIDETQTEYPYLEEETLYTLMGGETCNPNPPRSSCATAQQEMELFHWSYLNTEYHEDVINGWKDEGCYEKTRLNLGYRFVLESATIPSTARTQSDVCMEIRVKNVGWATPFNPRDVAIILRGSDGSLQAAYLPDIDLRTWYPSSSAYSIHASIYISNDVLPGSYEVLLWLPDPESCLSKNPDYSILLANADVPETNTGFNRLLLSMTVECGTESTTSNCPEFEELIDYTSTTTLRCFAGCDDIPDIPTDDEECLEIENGSFETNAGGTAIGWNVFGNGYDVTDEQSHSGSWSIKVIAPGTNTGAGAQQTMTMESGVRTVKAYVFSKAVDVPGNADDQSYSIYCDVTLGDGSNIWGLATAFNTGSHDWEEQSVVIETEKDIDSISFYVLYRYKETGFVYFDDFRVTVGEECQSVVTTVSTVTQQRPCADDGTNVVASRLGFILVALLSHMAYLTLL